MAAPTMQPIARTLLRDWGVLYLNPASPSGQTNLCRLIDLEDAAQVMTAAFQEIASHSPSGPKTKPGAALLRAPTAVTLTCTDGSATISSLTTYAAWMLGCTIRIAGDDQDNEILSSTTLARPFVGTGGAGISATVYADAITLDETTGGVLSPMLLAHGEIVEEATSRHEFLTRGGFPLPGGYCEAWADLPLWNLTRKPLSTRPLIFFLDHYYDSTLDYLTRRIRISPMPDTRQSIGWTSLINPLRVEVTNICVDWSGNNFTDPATKIPCVDGWIESIFLPIARQIGTGKPQFKNDGIKPEIRRQYEGALARLKGSTGSSKAAKTFYPW